MKKVTGFLTSDGRFFSDQLEAGEHQKKIDFETIINEYICKFDISILPQDVIKISHSDHLESFINTLAGINYLYNMDLPALQEMRLTMSMGLGAEVELLHNKLKDAGMVWSNELRIPIASDFTKIFNL